MSDQPVLDFSAPGAGDALGLGGDARMNCPGRPAGNWSWRVAPDADLSRLAARLRPLAEAYGRVGPTATYRAERGY